MANANATEELMELERQFWEAIKNRDGKTAAALSDDPCVVTGAQGFGSYTPKQVGAMMNDGRYELRSFRFAKNPEVQLIGDDVAVVAYRVHEDLVVEGKPVSLEATDSSTWVRRDGQWRCALHTEAILGDPFGRDRNLSQPPSPAQ
ncbi:MAG: nuclear transport factor 2 family protein [Archangium sp.]|nr:nuclear transport factor 2 family protein [Archangium sp.]MDP3574518.1 nuclear transport factor 2 family protein [Archangium sp.]